LSAPTRITNVRSVGGSTACPRRIPDGAAH
jgi:hypothetical protein